MKKTVKIIGYSILSILFIIMVLFVTASLSQNKIVKIALKKINESVPVPIEIEDVSFTLIKRFPYATVELSGVRIGAGGLAESEGNPLPGSDILTVKNVFVSVKTTPLFRGEFEVLKIELNETDASYKVDSLGNSNLDFLGKLNQNAEDISAADSAQVHSSTLPDLNLQSVKLKNTTIRFVNDTAKMAANLFYPSLQLSAKLQNNTFSGKVLGNVKLSDCSFGEILLSPLEEASVNFAMEYQSDTLEIKTVEVGTVGANLEFTGKVAFNQNLYVDLIVKSVDLKLDQLKKFIPEYLPEEYNPEDLAGNVLLTGTLKGVVNDSIMPEANCNVILKNGMLKIKDFPVLRNVNTEGTFTNNSQRNKETSRIEVHSLHAETGTSTADLTFSATLAGKPKYEVKSTIQFNLADFKSFIPDSVMQNISGKIRSEFFTKGELPDSIDPAFINLLVKNTTAKIDFSELRMQKDSLVFNDFSGKVVVNPGQIEVSGLTGSMPNQKIQIDNSSINAEFKGDVTQPQNLTVGLKTLQLETPQGILTGSAKIKNLNHPEFVLNTTAQFNLTELKAFLPDTVVKSLGGKIEAEITSFGKLNLDSIQQQMPEIVFNQSTLKLNAKHVSLVLPDTLQKISNVTGELKLENGTISVLKINGNALGIDFSADSVLVKNVYKTLILNQKEKLSAKGNLNFGAIDYAVLAPFIPIDSTGNSDYSGSNNEKNTDNQIPAKQENRNFTFEIKGKLSAKSIRYDKIFLEDISAKFNVTDSVYIADQFKSNSFQGSSINSIRYSLSEKGRQILHMKNHVEQMDIHEFLYAFDNFGQDSLISYENITGLFSGDLNSRFVFEADTLVTSDMRVMGNLALENGRIINYLPAMEVSKFTGLKELDNIELKTLKCDVFLFKNHMYIPVTDIVSSSMDLSTFGMQSLNDDYEYHLQLKLSEILKGKSKKLFERQKSSGDEIDETDLDKNTIKIIYAYTDGKQKMGFDTKKAQKAMERKIQVQQKMLSLIFYPTLVSYETGVK